MSSEQRYRVIERIAAGGMAEVYRAESASLQGFRKSVAIKRVLPHLAQNKQFIEMFIDEARLGARLSHSNCVQVFDIGMGDGTYFIVMEYVDGADLRSLLQWYIDIRGPFPIAEAVYVIMKVCEGLHYAHMLADEDGGHLGIVHRDVSPPNVLITKYGEIKVADFGLAKANTNVVAEEEGIIKGKYSYLAPEAIDRQEVDARSDLFATGAMLWELIAGRKLFQGKTDLETVRMVAKAQVPRLNTFNRQVDPMLHSIIDRSLARNSDERYQSCEEFSEALNQWLFSSGQPVGSFNIAKLVRDFQERRKKPDIADLLNATLQQHFNIVSVQPNHAQEDFLSSFADLESTFKPRAPQRSRPAIDPMAELAGELEDDPPRATPEPSQTTQEKPAERKWWRPW
ncbi:MAG: serine/threonine-protein kinase [Polyangiaceae bacterium]